MYRETSPVIHWAGANNPLWILRPSVNSGATSELVTFKPDKQPIGKFIHELPFNSYPVEILPGDKLYLFTDGFADQFGGEKGKKLKESNFRDLLIKQSNLSFQEQHTGLKKYLAEWKGNLEQVDDICIIGIKF